MAEKTLSIKLVVSGNGELKIKQFADGVAVSQKVTGDLDRQIKSLNGTVRMSANEWNNLNRELLEHKNSVIEGSVAYRQLDAQIKQVQNTRLAALNKSMSGVAAQSGAATAAVMELGRVVSDSPYGIRGVANNATQLASQIMFMSSTIDSATGKAIGLSAAMRNLWASMMGPAGVLVAFSAVIALWENYSMKGQEAEDATNDLNDALSRQAFLLNTIKNSGLGTEITYKAMAAVSDDIRKIYDDETLSLEERNKKIEEALSLLNDEERKREQINRLTELGQELAKQDLKATTDALINQYALLELEKQNIAIKKQEQAERGVFTPVPTTGLDQIKTNIKNLREALKLMSDLNLGPSKDGGSGGKPSILSVASYKTNAKDYEKEILATQKRIAKIENLGFNRRLAVRQDFEKEEMRIQHQAYLDKENERYARFQERLNDKEAKLKQEGKFTAQAEAEINKEREAAEKEHLRVIRKANESHNELLAIQEKEWELQRIQERDAQHQSDRALRALENQLRMEEEYEHQQNLLQLERDTMEGRKAIQTEYLNFAQASAKLLGKIGQENEGIQKAMFFLQKGAAIANVVVEASQAIASQNIDAASSRLANLKNYNAMGGFLNPAAGAAYLAMEANITREQVTGNTLTKISAATAIANILSTMIGGGTSVSGGGSGGGGGGTTVESGFNPNFNVIGSTGENQLASVIAQQTGDVRAFILWDDLQEGQGIYNNTVEDSAT